MEDPAKFFSSSIYFSEHDLKYSSISVRVIRGINLPVGDLSGTSDAFVEIEIHDNDSTILNTFKTEVIEKSLNPTWNYETSFDIKPSMNEENRKVVFKIFDWDRIGDPTFLGTCSLSFKDILVEHSARKKHTLELSHPKRKVTGTIIVDTAITCQTLLFLASLRSQKINDISFNTGESLSKAFPYAPEKLSKSDLPLWIVQKFYFPNCNDEKWKRIAIDLLKASHPFKPIAITNAGKNASVLVESEILYWFSYIEETNSLLDLGNDIELKNEFSKGLTEYENENFLQVLYFTLKPTIAGFPRAENLFTKCYQSTFGNDPLIELENNSIWKKLFQKEDSNDESKIEQNKSKFAQEMKLAKESLESVSSIEDLDNVANHLGTACLYTNNPNITLMCALFKSTDEQVEIELKQAALLGCTDAVKLLSLLKEHTTWRILQKSCYPFQQLLQYHKELILTTKNWNSFKYTNVLH